MGTLRRPKFSNHNLFINPKSSGNGRRSYSRQIPKPMRSEYSSFPLIWKIVAAIPLVAIAGGCYMYYNSHLEVVPYTGRVKMNAVSIAMERSLSAFIGSPVEEELFISPQEDAFARLVEQVGRRIVKATNAEDLFDWEFHVVKSDDVNAFATFGGKIFVCTGIIPVLKKAGNVEENLAALLGHEIGHCLARHTTERLSYLAVVYFVASMITLPASLRSWIFNLGFVLPYSRSHETEADFIGLQAMTDACYNPQAALTLEQSLGEILAEHEPPKYLNTHPPNSERLQSIAEWLPSTKVKYSETCAKHGVSIRGFMNLLSGANQKTK